MKILLTSHHLDDYRGTETFVWTMAKELSKNHEVTVFSFNNGKMADKIKEFAKVIDKPEGKYDLLIASQHTTYEKTYYLAKDRIFVSHGILRPLDKPPADCRTVAISEEVAKHYDIREIMRQPIDLETFKPATKEPKIVYLAHEPQKEMVDILNAFNKKYEIVSDVPNVEDKIRSASLVISGGRGVYEAMACRVTAIIYSKYGFDGYCGEVDELKKNNFSGRRYKKDLNYDSFLYEFNKARQNKACYDYIREHHDVKKVIERLKI